MFTLCSRFFLETFGFSILLSLSKQSMVIDFVDLIATKIEIFIKNIPTYFCHLGYSFSAEWEKNIDFQRKKHNNSAK